MQTRGGCGVCSIGLPGVVARWRGSGFHAGLARDNIGGIAMVRFALPTGLIVAAMSNAALAQDSCSAVRFAVGQSSATIRGRAPPDEAVCYTFAATPGQTARLTVAGRNMIISVTGIGDARDSWTFMIRESSTRFIVGQLMRSVSTEPYTVTLSVK
jgi:hypothetical protein